MLFLHNRRARATRRLRQRNRISNPGPFTEQKNLGFRCAERLHRSAQEIDDEFFAELKRIYTDPQIVELVATAAAFELFPRLWMVCGFRRRRFPAGLAGKKD